jgi:hypothetical protein
MEASWPASSKACDYSLKLGLERVFALLAQEQVLDLAWFFGSV